MNAEETGNTLLTPIAITEWQEADVGLLKVFVSDNCIADIAHRCLRRVRVDGYRRHENGSTQ